MNKSIKTTVSILFIVGIVLIIVLGWPLNIWWILFSIFQAYSSYLDSKETNKKGNFYFWIILTILWIILTVIKYMR